MTRLTITLCARQFSDSRELLRKYGLSAGHAPKLVLILGYPAIAFEKAVRRPFQSVGCY